MINSSVSKSFWQIDRFRLRDYPWRSPTSCRARKRERERENDSQGGKRRGGWFIGSSRAFVRYINSLTIGIVIAVIAFIYQYRREAASIKPVYLGEASYGTPRRVPTRIPILAIVARLRNSRLHPLTSSTVTYERFDRFYTRTNRSREERSTERSTIVVVANRRWRRHVRTYVVHLRVARFHVFARFERDLEPLAAGRNYFYQSALTRPRWPLAGGALPKGAIPDERDVILVILQCERQTSRIKTRNPAELEIWYWISNWHANRAV